MKNNIDSKDKYFSPAKDLQEHFKKAFREMEKSFGEKESLEEKIPSRAWVIHSKIKGKHRGDLASEIAFSLAKCLRCSPMEAGERVAEFLRREKDCYEYVDVVAPGFINVGLKNDYLRGKMLSLFVAMRDEKLFPLAPVSHKEKILFEYVSANPTGPLHVGHGRWAVVGDVLSCLLKKVNGEDRVWREFYVNDAGNQIKTLLDSVKDIREGKPVEEDGYHGDYLLRFKDDHSLDPVETLLAEQKKDLSDISVKFDGFLRETFLREDPFIDSILKILHWKGLTYEKDGATWFKSTLGGDDKDRVLVKSDGSYTYFLVDLAYHCFKMVREFFHLINLFGSDHHGYVKRLELATKFLYEQCFYVSEYYFVIREFVVGKMKENPNFSKEADGTYSSDSVAAEVLKFIKEKSEEKNMEGEESLGPKMLKALNSIRKHREEIKALERKCNEEGVNKFLMIFGSLRDLKIKDEGKEASYRLNMRHLLGQQVKLFRDGVPVKMSKRTGDIVTLREVVSEIGADAFRYFMCAQSINQTIDFDLSRAKEKSMSNPVFYVQYAHARCCSIKEKAKNFDLDAEIVLSEEEFDDSLFSQPLVRSMMNEILHFPELLLSISHSLEVHHLPRFLYDLSSLFHSLYSNFHFIDTSSPENLKKTKQYLFFTEFFRQFLATNLDILGISAPQKM